VEQVGISMRRVALLTVVVLLFTPIGLGEASGKQSMPRHRAGLVIQHSDLGVLTDCVRFNEHQISGYDLLKRSTFEIRAAQYDIGTGICWIDGEGCKTTNPDECFCTPVRSWSYWMQEPGAPVFDHGETYANGRVIHDGAIDYWTFGPHGTPPTAVYSIDQICGSAAHPTGAVRRVQHLDSGGSKLLSDRVGAGEVFGRARIVALPKECSKLRGKVAGGHQV
jgi:hypothetical protein